MTLDRLFNKKNVSKINNVYAGQSVLKMLLLQYQIIRSELKQMFDIRQQIKALRRLMLSGFVEHNVFLLLKDF